MWFISYTSSFINFCNIWESVFNIIAIYKKLCKTYQNRIKKINFDFHYTFSTFIETVQYASQPGFYPVHQELYYPPHLQPSREPSRGVYETARPQTYHLDQKPLEHYTLTPPSSHILHGTSIPISPAQPPKNTGSITAGYPVRNQTQYQPAPAPAAAIYTTQSRPLYQSPSTAMNYPRD